MTDFQEKNYSYQVLVPVRLIYREDQKDQKKCWNRYMIYLDV